MWLCLNGKENRKEMEWVKKRETVIKTYYMRICLYIIKGKMSMVYILWRREQISQKDYFGNTHIVFLKGKNKTKKLS